MRRRLLSVGWRIHALAVGALGVWLGLTLIFADPDDYTSPGFHAAIQVMPLDVHGVIFLLLGLGVLAGYGTQRHIVGPLIATSAYFMFWAGLFVLSWLENHHSPATGIPLYLYVAVSVFGLAMTAASEPHYG
jgi:hypothetical protein